MLQNIGLHAEQKALSHLLGHGLKLVAHNYRCRLGEVDLIMRDGDYLVFIEVRLRKPSSFGDGVVSITSAKKQKIIKTTSHYLLTHRIGSQYPIRFDVISIEGKSGNISWIKDAFNAD